MIESILLTATRIATFHQQQPLTNASGFFFMLEERLFLVTSRHVLFDEPSQHFPDRIEIDLTVDAETEERYAVARLLLPNDQVQMVESVLNSLGGQRC